MKVHNVALIYSISNIFWGCLCLPDPSVIKLPDSRQCANYDHSALQINYHHDDVTIQCREKINWTGQLPCVKIGYANLMTIDSCPFPQYVSEVFHKLGINYSKKLKIINNDKYENGTIPENCLQGVNNVKALTMEHNNLKYISGESFKGCDDLIELNISNNRIEVTNGTFKYLPHLESLYLVSNGLQDLPYGTFHNLNELRRLYLRSNKLSSIDSRLFNDLTKLETLDLTDNSLENLPELVFNDLLRLKTVELSMNRLNNVPKKLFKDNTELEKINLSHCKFDAIPINLFSKLTSLKVLYLEGNRISSISDKVFEDLTNLQELNLSFNEIELLPDSPFRSLNKLTSLDLSNNMLTSIFENSFYYLRNLNTLKLSNNRIKYIHEKSLHSLIKLKELMFAYNYINISLFTLINNNEQIERVNLSHNYISEMDERPIFYNNLRELDLSYNQINYINVHQLAYFTTITINLTYNRIETIYFPYPEVYNNYNGEKILELDGNPLHCDCSVLNFLQHLKNTTTTRIKIEADHLYCSSPETFANIAVKQVQENQLSYTLEEGNLNQNCLYKFRCWDRALLVNCSNSNLTTIPTLIVPKGNFNHTEVYMQNNALTSGPARNTGYESITVLDLSHNKIQDLTWLPPKLEVLKLSSNNISSLKSETIDLLKSSSISTLKLGANPWRCDCNTTNISSFLIINSVKMQIDVDDIKCNGTDISMVDMSEETMCPNPQMWIMWICISTLFPIIMFAVAVALYFRYKTEIRVFLFVHCGCVWPEPDEDKTYDAFISYSHKDEQFVLDELLPVLEQGSTPYKVCIHIRDFEAGEFISKQIVTSVAESRRTVVILSPSYLESEWGKMEFRTAHTQAIKEGTARVILILYGNIDLNADLDEELKAYIRTYTYLKWGDPWFWHKFRYALPHLNVAKNKSNTKNTCFQFTKQHKTHKTFDKNLDLLNIPPSMINPISTPPIPSPSFFKNV